MYTSVRLQQSKNTYSPIVPTEAGMFIVVRLSQRQNAPLLMVLSVEGSDTSFTAKQMAKQSSPSTSTPSGMWSFSNKEQPVKAFDGISLMRPDSCRLIKERGVN